MNEIEEGEGEEIDTLEASIHPPTHPPTYLIVLQDLKVFVRSPFPGGVLGQLYVVGGWVGGWVVDGLRVGGWVGGWVGRWE